MNWRRLIQFQSVPPSQAALALGVIGLAQAWALYVPEIGIPLRPFLAGLGAVLLLPVLIKYLTSFNAFITDIRHPLSGSLMAPMSMALLILCDYLAVIAPIIAYPLWFASLLLHLTMMVLFFGFQLMNFRIANIVPSWFLYPVGLISSSLVNTCITIYFFMLPLVLYRLVFEGMLPQKARPTLAIMAAPINLTLAAYLVNVEQPDPILTGALAGIAVTMTLLIYLCYIRLLRLKFQPSIAAVTFPSVISAIAMFRLTSFFSESYPQWHWMHKFGIFELSIATGLVIWVSVGYVRMYWPEIFNTQKTA